MFVIFACHSSRCLFLWLLAWWLLLSREILKIQTADWNLILRLRYLVWLIVTVIDSAKVNVKLLFILALIAVSQQHGWLKGQKHWTIVAIILNGRLWSAHWRARLDSYIDGPEFVIRGYLGNKIVKCINFFCEIQVVAHSSPNNLSEHSDSSEIVNLSLESRWIR